MANDYILEMDHIEKTFPGVHALSDVHFDLIRGEVHALVGENGAGKSTLMKVLNGIYTKDSGTIKLNGKEVQFKGVRDAMANGIVFIHQEISLVPYLTIAENIFLGEEKKKGGFVDFDAMRKEAQKILDRLNMPLDAGEYIYHLTIAQQQMVEVAKAVSKDAKIIVMDEPTASLSAREVDSLYDQVRNLKKHGVSIIYISHRLEELYIVCDRFTVLRDGGYVATKEVEGSTREEVVSMMVGREMGDNFYAERVFGSKEVIMEVKNLSSDYVKNVSFDLRKGEVLGFSGLIGAGRTETMRAMLGLDRRTGGEVFIDGKKVLMKGMKDAVEAGICLVPEDRRGQGLVLSNTVGFNIILPSLKRIYKALKINYKLQDEIIDTYSQRMRIRMSGPDQRAGNLSGGNQQKVVLAKWLAKNPKVLILDEPTRGIDVGAKAEIYQLMVELAKEGVSIIMISSELPEIINMSSRIVVMYEGEVQAILDAETEEVTQEKVMTYGAGLGGKTSGGEN
ncbi:sugar ABC transporter ATP-binding protein [Anaerolentibacter hominis]|uniref:sugar ABC transporter ATP-binding protein n=1 Tax=Anaerolentibacter hominis TaxID=3079009 RepID=UPI0031B83B77